MDTATRTGIRRGAVTRRSRLAARWYSVDLVDSSAHDGPQRPCQVTGDSTGAKLGIDSPLTVFVDESGTPYFRTLAESNGRTSGYAVCAAGVPALSGPRLHGILPRGRDGALLKASHKEFTPNRLVRFLHELLETDVTISLFLLETSSDRNARLSREYTERVNRWRRHRGNPPVSAVHLTRNLTTSRAIRHAWTQAWGRLGWVATRFELVLDDVTMPKLERELFEHDLVRIAQEHGLTGPTLRWATIEQEPFLRIPDLVASVYPRQASHRDTLAACQVLENARAQGRIEIEDEFTPPEPPTPPEVAPS